MSKLSRLRARKGQKRLKDLSNEEAKELAKPLMQGFENLREKLASESKEIMEWQAKKTAQPFKTNDLLEDLIREATPLWVSIAILVISVVTMIISTIALFK